MRDRIKWLGIWMSMAGLLLIGIARLAALPGDSTDPPMYPKWPMLINWSTNTPPLNPPWPSSKIEWMNDAVFYTTNLVMDVERMKSLPPGPSIFFYTKDDITTNKVGPWFFGKGDRQVEIGFRSDGVVVWRNRK